MRCLSRLLLLFVLFALMIPSPIQAQDGPSHALLMHGTPKHSADFKSYLYVNKDAPKGGSLRQAAVGTFDTINPFTLKGKAAQGLSLVHDRLMDRSWDEPFTLYPLIARAVDVPTDRSSITFYLDPRAKFQDGSPITADDVLFSFTTLRDSGRPNMRRVYKLVKEAQVIDKETIRFTLASDHDRETVMILAIMPILSKAYWQARNFDAATLDTNMVTSGPYRITAIEPGRRVVFSRVKDYWAQNLPVRVGQNNFDSLVYDYFRDESVAFESFKSGDLNFRRETDLTQWANAYDFPAMKNGQMQRAAIPHGRAEAVRGFIFNTRRPPFDDIHVREALSLAFDFEWVNKALFFNQLKRTESFFPNTDLAAHDLPDDLERRALEGSKDPLVFGPAWQAPKNASSADRRAHLQRADQLLKQAGWIIRDRVRVNAKTGRPLHFEILLGAPEDEKIALSYIRALARLGVSARARTLDTAAFRDRLNGYDYDMLFYFWTSSLSPGGEQLLYWGCQAAKEDGRFNYAGICDPQVDRLSRAIAQTTTREGLRSTTRALDRLLTFGHYLIPFGYNPADLIAYDRSIKHPAVTPLYGAVPETWWAETPPKK